MCAVGCDVVGCHCLAVMRALQCDCALDLLWCDASCCDGLSVV